MHSHNNDDISIRMYHFSFPVTAAYFLHLENAPMTALKSRTALYGAGLMTKLEH